MSLAILNLCIWKRSISEGVRGKRKMVGGRCELEYRHITIDSRSHFMQSFRISDKTPNSCDWWEGAWSQEATAPSQTIRSAKALSLFACTTCYKWVSKDRWTLIIIWELTSNWSKETWAVTLSWGRLLRMFTYCWLESVEFWFFLCIP